MAGSEAWFRLKHLGFEEALQDLRWQIENLDPRANIMHIYATSLAQNRSTIDQRSAIAAEKESLAVCATPKRGSGGDDTTPDSKRRMTTQPSGNLSISLRPNGRRQDIFILQQRTDILEYLGSEDFRVHLDNIHDRFTPCNTVLEELITILKPWQAIGIEKLIRLASRQSPFRAQKLRKLEGMDGFILVVCRKSCMIQWYDEIFHHFKSTHRPRVCVLDSADENSMRLDLDWDIVICTKDFLRQCYKTAVEFESQVAVANIMRGEPRIQALKLPPRPFTPLPFKWHDNRKPISTLILDESQDAKNPESLLNEAIRALKYETIFMLTGTPIHNRWDDLGGQLILLPEGHRPFESMGHFQAVFASPSSHLEDGVPTRIKSAAKAGLTRLPRYQKQVLTTLICGLLIARPKDVLSLPPCKRVTEVVDLSDHFEVIFIILKAVRLGKWYLQQSRDAGLSKPIRREKFKRRAFAAFSKAQSFSANTLLWTPPQDPELSVDLGIGVNEELQRIGQLYTKFLEKTELPAGTRYKDLDEVKREELVRFVMQEFAKEQREKRFLSYHSHSRSGREQITDDDGDDSSGLQDADSSQVDSEDEPMINRRIQRPGVVPSVNMKIKLRDLNALKKASGGYKEQDFHYADDEVDETYNPKVIRHPKDNDLEPDDDTSDDDSESEMCRPRRQGRTDPEFTRKWLERLARQPDDIIFSPRIAQITDLVGRIRQERITEKIVIVSQSLKFLDIVGEALRRKVKRGELQGVGVAEFNGTVDATDRADVLRRFNTKFRLPNILLLTAGVGDAGLNIPGACRMILAEPLYSPGQKEQLIGRVLRMPQDKEVTVYELFAPLSDIDQMVRDLEAEKDQTRNDVLAPLITYDRAPPSVGRLPDAEQLDMTAEEQEDLVESDEDVE